MPRSFLNLIGLEILGIITIILFSYLIYKKTKTIYSLTQHKGILYFRLGFIYIALAYIFLLLGTFLKFNLFSIESNFKILFRFFSLFHLIGLGFLFSSLFSKHIKNYQIYFLSCFIFLLGIIFHTKSFFIFYSTILFFALGIVSILRIKNNKNKNSFSKIYFIYILIFISWLLTFLSQNLLEVGRLSKSIKIIITAIIFVYIYFLVSKKLK